MMERCVLVVEDEPIIRMDTVSMLEDAGLTVVDFDRADDALQYTQDHDREVAAIFTDINLRGKMDGIELASAVVRTHPDIAMVVTSGRYESRPEQLPAEAKFLTKPWLPLQVISAMQEAAID